MSIQKWKAQGHKAFLRRHGFWRSWAQLGSCWAARAGTPDKCTPALFLRFAPAAAACAGQGHKCSFQECVFFLSCLASFFPLWLSLSINILVSLSLAAGFDPSSGLSNLNPSPMLYHFSRPTNVWLLSVSLFPLPFPSLVSLAPSPSLCLSLRLFLFSSVCSLLLLRSSPCSFKVARLLRCFLT